MFNILFLMKIYILFKFYIFDFFFAIFFLSKTFDINSYTEGTCVFYYSFPQ